MNIFSRFFSSKVDENHVELTKYDHGDRWAVRKGFNILYVGTKEKCKLFMKNTLSVS